MSSIALAKDDEFMFAKRITKSYVPSLSKDTSLQNFHKHGFWIRSQTYSPE